MIKKFTNQTVTFSNQPRIIGTGSVVGEKEGKGPLAEGFDLILEEDTFGEDTWEKSESKMFKTAVSTALQKSHRSLDEVDVLLGGDLLNQLMSTSFMVRDFSVPFIGLYGACSTMTESLLMGSLMVDGGYAELAVTGASSHYCSAERQFRMPLEHGNQRPPTAQWTVTGSGSAIVSSTPCEGDFIRVTHGTIGKVIDAGIKDANQMGAAMAPAAVDTIYRHLTDLGRSPDFYDLIVTGDLGMVGKKIALDMLKQKGIDLSNVFDDCGAMMFHKDQDTHAGGSGCGCSASVFCGPIYKRMQKGEFQNVMLVSTGAMLSTISPFQGESIPSIAHAVSIANVKQ